MAVKTIAYCWGTGEIEFGKELPEGAIAIARGQEGTLRKTIDRTAKVCPDTARPFVPGMTSGSDIAANSSALCCYIESLAVHNKHGFRTVGV